MPAPLLRAYIDRADQVAAERALVQMSAVSAGTGAMKKGDRDRLVGSWRQAAARARRRAGGLVEQLAGLGVAIVKERRGG